MKNRIVTLLAVSCFAACTSSQKVGEPISPDRAKSEIKVVAGDCGDLGDPLSIGGVEFNSESLLISVSHSGGCESHEYTLIRCENILASEPPQTEFGIRHNGNGDSCEAYLTSVLRVPRTSVAGFSQLSGISGQKIQLGGE